MSDRVNVIYGLLQSSKLAGLDVVFIDDK